MLANDQHFYLIYTERSWIAQVEGKKFYLASLNEEQRAAAAIARILRYGGGAEPDKDTPSGEVPTGGETPADETTPEAPTEEIPPTEEAPEETLPA